MQDPSEDDLLPIDRSGSRRLVGYRSSVPDDQTGVCALEIGPQHLNRLGLLHGGFVSMLLDNGCGIAVRAAMGDIDGAAVTVTLAVNFIASVSSGRVTATGRVTGGGRSLKFAESELRDETGRLLATATATFRILEKR
ncbi:PaaI family thioesterase [Paenirhodobacter sp.]|uniref:PaaI family thioesterase n=1 Tax=Paenirhodobacter sp. TaxID=1965326 RepID=UPI003B421946